MRKKKGVSLLEILVVITIFAALALISARGILLTLRGSRKSGNLGTVRENLDYSIAIMERQLRNAESVDCTLPTQVDYEDKNNQTAYFSCENIGAGSDGYVSSSSARLTNTEVNVTSCQFTCDPGTGTVPPSVNISLTAQDATSAGVEGATVTLNTRIFLRTY